MESGAEGGSRESGTGNGGAKRVSGGGEGGGGGKVKGRGRRYIVLNKDGGKDMGEGAGTGN